MYYNLAVIILNLKKIRNLKKSKKPFAFPNYRAQTSFEIIIFVNFFVNFKMENSTKFHAGVEGKKNILKQTRENIQRKTNIIRIAL